ncbi:hypothetical protein [Clostridium sporogenes]|uniref:hypothetical protein n=1 Tax=Clostridium sporogenes TaxID=1509 RepID=UPI000724AF35|nr:hypothetical protein [Clostridium sporogenes]KRU40032.1 hypothetical protein VT94_25090 [Clostridium sporogenes]MBY7065153.1 hypothetical protein [Clostridium sporogenes]MBY7071801.1 hypothetical protein [Clostridium sporogenes]MCW6065859.1 hypothetical protein [Clostridium sporogenes]OQP88570.1 hypothetical protein VT93_0202140 [Clostridium sporogenes]
MKNRDFKKGDIIIFCDEEFQVIENYGYSGKVKEVYGGTIINNFHWNYQGSKCELKSN